MSWLLPALQEACGNGGFQGHESSPGAQDRELLQDKRSEERHPWNKRVGCTLTQTSPGFQVEKSNPSLLR